jgi:hypothetical protein
VWFARFVSPASFAPPLEICFEKEKGRLFIIFSLIFVRAWIRTVNFLVQFLVIRPLVAGRRGELRRSDGEFGQTDVRNVRVESLF